LNSDREKLLIFFLGERKKKSCHNLSFQGLDECINR